MLFCPPDLARRDTERSPRGRNAAPSLVAASSTSAAAFAASMSSRSRKRCSGASASPPSKARRLNKDADKGKKGGSSRDDTESDY